MSAPTQPPQIVAPASDLRPCLPWLSAFLLTFTLLRGSAATLMVLNVNDTGPGSLRQAINDSNNTNGLDTIAFQIPGVGVQTISPGSALPPITDPAIIDGTTQPGFVGLPLI